MSTLITKNNNDTVNTITIHSTNLFDNEDIYNNYYVDADMGLCSRNIMGVWNTSDIITDANDNKNKEKEKKDMNNFLDLKKSQEFEKLDEEKYNKIDKVQDEDTIIKIMKATENRIRGILELKEEDVLNFPIYDYMTKETEAKIKEIREEIEDKKQNIRNKYKEIEALCENASWKERMEIYRMYNLIED